MAHNDLFDNEGHPASAEAKALRETLSRLKNETIPWVKSHATGDDKAARIKALRQYQRRIEHDLGVALGNDNCWDNLT